MDMETKQDIIELRKKPGWTLRRERKELTLKLKDAAEGTDEYNNILDALAKIEKVLTERANTWSNVGKTIAGVGVTIAGLMLTYSVGDKGDSLPNKSTGKFTDGLLGMFRK